MTTTPDYLRLSAALAIVDLQFPGLESYDRAAKAYDLRAQAQVDDLEIAMEREAEYRNERYFEDRGYEEARAQEIHEAQMGVGAW